MRNSVYVYQYKKYMFPFYVCYNKIKTDLKMSTFVPSWLYECLLQQSSVFLYTTKQ